MPKFLDQDTFRTALYVAGTLLVLTLTGVYATFERRVVITDLLTLSSTFLYIALFVGGFMTAVRKVKQGIGVAILNGIVGSLTYGVGLALLTLFVTNVDVSFVFRNLQRLHPGAVTFGQESLEIGLVILLLVSVLIGAVAGVLAVLPKRLRMGILMSVILTLVAGILQNQIDRVVSLVDALTLVVSFVAGYVIARVISGGYLRRVIVGVIVGAAVALVLLVIVPGDGLARGSALRGTGIPPTIAALALDTANIVNVLTLFVTTMVMGIAGALVGRAPRIAHNGAWYAVAGLLTLAMLNWFRGMTVVSGLLTLAMLFAVFWFLTPAGTVAEAGFLKLPMRERRRMTITMAVIGFAILLVVPSFAGQSLSNTFNLVMLYIIMAIGLNVMVGYTGLLDLGYVAAFAFGAYTAGLLTTPSMITCGGMTGTQIAEAGLSVSEACAPLSFWAAIPFAVLVAALARMALGVPVLRLRGDYLAIVTLGFGEIVNRVLKSDTFKDLLGGPQGISPVPVPTINLTSIAPWIDMPSMQVMPSAVSDFFTAVRVPDLRWTLSITRATDIYYLYLIAVIIIAFLILRLTNTRLGRAWRAIREDEDVAEAMGIHLVKYKLLAFGVSSALAGVGGAIFGASLQGVFPDSFVLLVSINVLSVVIIGGLGSIPGVFVGALILVGMPEVLRELQDYRLLVFGAVLVITMIVKPQGLVPPEPPRLSLQARGGAAAQPQGAGD
jgi:branched-chain amino acid transport system permease protein